MGHTSFHLNRRRFLQASGLAAGALFLSPAHLKRAFASGPITVGDGPYGPLGAFDSNGIALPAGFSSREVARGASPVSGSTPPYVWHNATDGQATFATLGSGGGPDGGWILVANSEMPIPGAGGASAVEFAPGGGVERAYRILAGTLSNCAGGPTPWGTWLSCEEHDEGKVWECDPTGAKPALPKPALGVFAHEAACVDPVGKRLYLTEDEGDGCWYRFTPRSYPSLDDGLLECAVVDAVGHVTWAPVPDPAGGARNPTRGQVGAAAHFDGGEGTWFDNGIVYFTTKGDDRVRAYDTGSSMLEVLYDAAALGPDAPLSGVDNITVSPAGDIYVCEDGRDHDICLITPEFELARFLKLDPVKHAGPPEPSPVKGNETVGVVFSPSGDRMYFGAQRSFGVGGVPDLPAGVVYEISGPFRGRVAAGGGGGSGGGGGDGSGGGGGSNGDDGGSSGAAGGPRVGLRTRRRKRIRRFLRDGLPLLLELDELVGVKASLRTERRSAGGTETVTIGKASTSVAVEGDVALLLRASGRAERLLAGAERVRAQLTVTATDADGNRTVVRRSVLLRR
ncbi:MAG TPA: alkaline phosphatase PhoX [Solirubrobacterales bacterium]